MRKKIQIIQFFFFSKVISWYTGCDTEGKCFINEPIKAEKIYLFPGYLPFYPSYSIIPLQGDSTSNTENFTLEIFTGYPKKGIFKNSKFNYECSNGINECINSCCLNGFCKGSPNLCNKKIDEVKIIFILTLSFFYVFFLFYWICYFILGCNYNKLLDKENINKENAGYGNTIKNIQNAHINHNYSIDHENISHGTDPEEYSKQSEENSKYNQEEKINKVVKNLDKVNRKKFNIED
jgi:hypothetical protein